MSTDTPPETNGQRYEGYTDYYTVSQSLTRSIDRAIQEYAAIQRCHAENDRLNFADNHYAGEHILATALRLMPELQDQRDTDPVYDEILVRWLNDDHHHDETDPDPEPPQEGSINALMTHRLDRNCPEFLHQLVIDIRTAGWELGYLQAGRRQEADEEWSEDSVVDLFN